MIGGPVIGPLVRASEFPETHPTAHSRLLYLCVFADAVKVGVTERPQIRVAHLKLQRGGFEGVYFRLFLGWQARNVENLISRAFGGPTGTKGRASEWFGREHLEDALAMMRDDALCETAKDWRSRKLDAVRAARCEPLSAYLGGG